MSMSERARKTVHQYYNKFSPYRKGGDSNRFFVENDIKALWSKEALLSFIEGIDQAVREQDLEKIQDGHLKIISILVRMNWTHWDLLTPLLLKPLSDGSDPILKDSMLPFAGGNIPECLKLDPSDIDHKWNGVQREFHPFLIEQGIFKKCPPEYTLPFLSEEPAQKNGAFAHVSFVEVAAGCFANEEGNTLSNPKRLVVKKILDRENGRREKENLEILKGSLSTHKNILTHSAMFLHNNQYHILYERATKDLQQFLDDEESDRYFSSPRQIILLLSEFSVLSSALAFLHDKVEHSNTRYICCHMDLKPDNIFVFTDTNDHIKFKIADLGISKLRSRPLERDRPGFRKSHNVYEDEIRYLPTTMNTSASRGPGTFQAPEMYKHEKVGRASDVWSLGCLLMVFVIRMFGGVDGYQEFENARHVRERYSNDYFHFDGKVKPEVTERLDKLPESYENKLERLGKDCEKSVFEDLKQLIKMCLKEDAKSRIKSADFHRKLKEIVKYMKQALWKTRLDVLKGGKSLNFSNDVEATSKIRFSSERINTLGLSTYRACFDDLVKMEIIEGQNAARIRFQTLKQYICDAITESQYEKCWEILVGSGQRYSRTLDKDLTYAFFFLYHLHEKKLINLDNINDQIIATQIDERGRGLFTHFAAFIPCNCGAQCTREWNFANPRGIATPPEGSQDNDSSEKCQLIGGSNTKLKNELKTKWDS